MEILTQLWGVLPLVVLYALRRAGGSLRLGAVEAWLFAAVCFGVLVWFLSNLLGAVGWLHTGPLRVAWGILGAIAIGVIARTRGSTAKLPKPSGWIEWALAGVCAVLLASTLARALLSPPNTVDVLNYHLPRQLMWLQQGGLEPFITVNDRQNMMPPLAETIGLQFLGLTGDDYWANLPQWGAYAGSAAAVALLARLLGAGRAASLLAAALALLLPMAYHEASNAKNDLMAAFWLLCAAVQIVKWRKLPSGPVPMAFLAATLALAWLTKSTAMLFAPILLACGLWSWARETPRATVTRCLMAGVFCGGLLIAPFHLRNLAWYGTPLGEHRGEEGGDQMVKSADPRLWVSTLARTASLHLLTPSEGANRAVLGGIDALHRKLGIKTDDPRNTLWITGYDPRYTPRAESVAGAPAHFIIGLPLLVLLSLGFAGNREPRWLAGSILISAFALCILLKWQPWAARLHLPLFLMGIATVVTGFAGVARHRSKWMSAGVLSCAAFAWLPGAETVARPLWTHPMIWELDRDLSYYRMMTHLALRDAPLTGVIKESGVKSILINSIHDIPYPLMRKIRRVSPGIKFAGAPAENVSAVSPDALLVMAMGLPDPLYVDYDGRSDWRLVGQNFGGGLYLPESKIREFGWWERLPAFCGWTNRGGLSASSYAFPEGVCIVYEPAPSESVIDYRPRGRSMILKGEVRATKADFKGGAIVFRADGATVAHVELASVNRQSFQIVLPSGNNHRRLWMTFEGGGGWVFSRLTVNDVP